MAERVLTAPLAVIKVNGVAIGKMKNIRVSENLTRGRVSGIGQLTADELPPLSWTGTLSCSFYNIDFNKSQIPGALQRNVNTLKEWVDTVMLDETGVQLDIMKKVKDTETNGIITSKLAVYATVKDLFLDTEGFDISEGQISNRDQSFTYITPILFSL